MQVFKFGGASIRNAGAIKKVAQIIQSYAHQPMLVIISAMGKTTNALENILQCSNNLQSYDKELEEVFDYHRKVVLELNQGVDELHHELATAKKELIHTLTMALTNKDQRYDQVVSVGELISTKIVYGYLKSLGIKSRWIDARKYIVTDRSFREGRVNWERSDEKIKSLSPYLDHEVLITQGFIASDGNGNTTTLGREGSDFSAAIFASCLNAESVTVWKDVPGVMSADPKRIPTAVTFDELPFREAAEMTYYGASVIHPKTIKPLANKNIPLFVKSFEHTELPGTRIHECKVNNLPPLIVFKNDQCLVSCQVTDYTFIDESQIVIIFNALSSCGLKVNLMQNSAISFSFCVDFNEEKVLGLIQELSNHFEVFYNTRLTLITIKNYDSESFEKYRKYKDVVLEQSSRSTLQVLVRSK